MIQVVSLVVGLDAALVFHVSAECAFDANLGEEVAVFYKLFDEPAPFPSKCRTIHALMGCSAFYRHH